MAGETILVVEDEKQLAKVLRFNLEREGYRVLYAGDGAAGLDLYNKEGPALILLDVMVPKLDGFEFCRIVRRKSSVPILMLTARKDEVDRVLGLELGADDYVTKPFSVRELLARIKGHLRRASPSKSRSAFRTGGLEVDPERFEVRVKGKPVSLSPREFEFLKCLVEADGRALSRDQLLEKVWGVDRGSELSTNTVDQHIARLRDKLGAEAERIVTVKNVGYRLRQD